MVIERHVPPITEIPVRPPPRKFEGEFYIGLDCGQARDYSAISILNKSGDNYQIVRLERLPLNMSYPLQIEHLFSLMHKRPLDKAMVTLAIDYTGVGRPVVDLAQDRGLKPIGIAITGGNAATWNKGRTRASVPKRDLIGQMQMHAQNDKLKVAPRLKYGPTLAKELESFKVKIDPRTAHASYGSWREGEHDDLILATAIALWTAEHRHDEKKRAIARFFSSGGRRSWA
jgi:hypothetical protein